MMRIDEWKEGEREGGVSQHRGCGVRQTLTDYPKYPDEEHIRPQTEENMVSRPLCLNQASDRSVSSWVGDHQRIPVVVCFFSFAMKSQPNLLRKLDQRRPR